MTARQLFALVWVLGSMASATTGRAWQASPAQQPNMGPPRTATISGRVTGEDGQPIAGLPVHAARWLSESGSDPMHNQLWPMEMATTDSDGRYTIRGLWRNRVVVAAVAWKWPPESADGSSRLVFPPAVGAEGRPPTGLLTTYFPGVTEALKAQTLTIAAGPVDGIDFVVRRGPLFEVAARFNPPEPANSRLPGALLTPREVPDRFGGNHVIRASVRGGTHTFQHVPAGSYYLSYESAQGWVREPLAVGTNPAPVQQVFEFRPYFSVSGRLELHSTKTALTPEARAATLQTLKVYLMTVPFLGGNSWNSAVGADGTFRFTNVSGNFYSAGVSINAPSRDPREGWQTVFVYLNGTDSWGTAVELRSDVTDARLVAADSGTLVHGVVRHATQGPIGHLRVVIFPEDEALWRDPPERRAGNSTIDAQGRYAIHGIRPGRYYVTTIDPSRFSYDRFREAKASGPPLELGIGETKVFDVTVR